MSQSLILCIRKVCKMLAETARWSQSSAALQTVDDFSGECFRFCYPGLLISASANTYPDVAGTFKNIQDPGSATGHPKRFIADAGYFQRRPRLLAFLFLPASFSVAIAGPFFILMEIFFPELLGVACASAFSSLRDSEAD